MGKGYKMEKWMKKHYPDLTDFDNLQFVKDCKEEGIKECKQKVKEVIDKLMPLNVSDDTCFWKPINRQLKKELGIK